MKYWLLLCAVAFPAQALDLRIGTSTPDQRANGVTWVAEHQYKRTVFSAVYMNKEKNQGILMVQRHYGKKFYFRPGIGITNRTHQTSVFNFCTTIGWHGYLDINWSHCSNANTREPNHGTDYVSVGIIR